VEVFDAMDRVREKSIIDPGGIQREDVERKEWKYMRERGGIQ
jgi:hypothetical protein